MAMFFIALVCVVIAAAMEPDQPDEPEPIRSPVWVALGGSDGVPPGPSAVRTDTWVARLAASLPERLQPRLHNLSVSGGTVTKVRSLHVRAAVAMQPDVVTAWLVIDDLRAGTPLDVYERELRALVDSLTAVGARVILGNVPPFRQALVVAESSGDLPIASQISEDWNVVIARVARQPDVELVDLSHDDVVQPLSSGPASDDGWTLSDEARAQLAERFRPAVTRALIQATGDNGPVGPCGDT